MEYARRLARAMFEKANGQFQINAHSIKTHPMELAGKTLRLKIETPWNGGRGWFPMVRISEVRDGSANYFFDYYRCFNPWGWEAKFLRESMKAYRAHLRAIEADEKAAILSAAKEQQDTRLRLISGGEETDVDAV